MQLQTKRSGINHYRTLRGVPYRIEDGSADVGRILGESEVLIADLEGEFAHVAEYDDQDAVFGWVELREGLSMTRLGLEKDVHTEGYTSYCTENNRR